MAKRIVVEFAGDTGNLDKAFAKVKGTSSGIEKTFKAVAGAAAFGLVTDQIHDAVSAASDLNESLNKSNQVFGTAGAAIDSWAKGASSSIGLSRQAALEAAGTFGNMFAQLGVGSDQAATMSKNIVGLAADFASFHNADIADVILAQSAAFRGEYDALQRFLPLINAAAVEQEALKETGKKSTGMLTEQDKALAVNTLMFKGAGDAVGDFARTSDGAANQQRTLAAEFEDMKAALGQGLLPVFTDIAGFLVNDVIPAFQQLTNTASEPPDVKGFKGFTNAFKDELRDLVGWVASIPAPVMKLFGLFSDSFKDAAGKVDHFAEQMHRSSTEAYLGAHAEDAHNAAVKVAKDLLKGTTDATDKRTGASQKTTKQLDAEKKAEQDLGDARLSARSADLALEEATHNLGVAQDEYNKFLETGGIDAEKVKQAQDDLISVQKDVEKATLDVAKAQDEVNKALKPASPEDQAKVGRDVAAATDAVTIAQLDQTDALNEYERIALSATSTEEEKTRAWVRANDATRTLADAQDRVKEATAAQTEASKQGTTASQAYKDANAALLEKQTALKDVEDKRKVSQDALNSAQALGKTHTEDLWKVTDSLKNAQLDLDSKTWGAKKAQDELKTSIDATTSSVRTARGNVVGYTDELNNIPKDIKTTLTYEEIYAVPGGTATTDQQAYAKYLQSYTKAFPNADPMPYDMWVKSSYNPNRKRAMGGPVTAGWPYTVGEKGVETFVPDRNGTIVPNGALGATTINLTVNGWVGNDVELTRRIVAAIREEQRRSGPLGLN